MAYIDIKTHVKWWLYYLYIPGCKYMYRFLKFLGLEPKINYKKMIYWILKGIKFETCEGGNKQ